MNATDDWYDVARLTEHSYRIRELDRFMQYLVVGDDRALVVDAGIGVGDLRSLVENLVDVPVSLLLTHSHWDHIGAAAQFEDVFVHERERGPDGRVGIDTLTDEFVGRPAQYAAEWQAAGTELPERFDPEAYTITDATDVDAVTDGDTFDLGGRTLEIVHLPGHSPGHVAALDREAGVVYGGDVIHEDHTLYVHFDDCDLGNYAASFDRLCALYEGGVFDTLLTGHNPPLAGDDLAILARLRDALHEIAAGDREYDRIETKYGPAHQFQAGESTILTKISVP
jgi:glyoxylase-like metal-dependent hydrolase (beta-lactamase superfamily II)